MCKNETIKDEELIVMLQNERDGQLKTMKASELIKYGLPKFYVYHMVKVQHYILNILRVPPGSFYNSIKEIVDITDNIISALPDRVIGYSSGQNTTHRPAAVPTRCQRQLNARLLAAHHFRFAGRSPPPRRCPMSR